MKREIATFAPVNYGEKVTMWHRGHSWYIGIKRDNCTCTILHAGSEQYIRGVWKRKYVKRKC